MIETAVQFGPTGSLVGILTRPAEDRAAEFALLSFNAGVLTRIGPHRLNVKLARRLAESGETSFRFDLSGQGDSQRSTGSEDFREQALRDIGHAMDHLERHFGIRRFALYGICSGATQAFAAAVADPRVAGVMMFDGHWYPTLWSTLVRHWKRFRVISWRAAAAAVWRRVPGRGLLAARHPDADVVDAADVPANPPRAEFVRSLQAMVDRRVAVYFMYSGSAIDYYSYANQFRDAFGREPFFQHVRCDFRPDLDHTLISLAAQRRMIGAVCAWMPAVHRACATAPEPAVAGASVTSPAWADSRGRSCPPRRARGRSRT